MKNLRFLSSWTALFLLLAAVVPGGAFFSAGCHRQDAEKRAAESGAAPVSHAAATPERETWDVCSFQGARVGAGRTRVFHDVENGEDIVRTEYWVRMKVLREGTEAEQDMQYTNIAKPNGQLLRFESTETLGNQPVKRRGRVVGKRLEIENLTTGKTDRIEWQPEYRGFDALEETLRAQPLQPGGRRTLRALVPGFFEVAILDLQGGDWETVELPEGSQKLLRVEVLNQFRDGKQFRQTMWVDRTGEVLRNQMEGGSFESVRTTKEKALASEAAPKIDLFKATSIPLDRPIPSAHLTKKIRYRVAMKGGDPAKVFLAGPSQKIQSVDANTAEITVYAVRPDQPGNTDAPADPPTDDDRQPNGAVQSDDPLIEKLAGEAGGEESDPWRTAVALERFVKDYIQKVDYTQVFSTAVEVAKSRKGDCTEHAVLLAALCRAKGIPARVAIGLVYCEDEHHSTPYFAYHMWTEVFIGQLWIPLDGTLGLGGIGGAHLKLGQTNLRNATIDTSFLPVIQAVGKLMIEVVEVDPR